MVRRNMPTALGLCNRPSHTTKAIKDVGKSRFTYTWARRLTGCNLHLTKRVSKLKLLNVKCKWPRILIKSKFKLILKHFRENMKA